MSVLVFVSHDFELGRTWLAQGVDRQSRTGLIFGYASANSHLGHGSSCVNCGKNSDSLMKAEIK